MARVVLDDGGRVIVLIDKWRALLRVEFTVNDYTRRRRIDWLSRHCDGGTDGRARADLFVSLQLLIAESRSYRVESIQLLGSAGRAGGVRCRWWVSISPGRERLSQVLNRRHASYYTSTAVVVSVPVVRDARWFRSCWGGISPCHGYGG